jgi:uncharacterized protein
MPWRRTTFFALAVTLMVTGPPAWADCRAGFEAFKSADYQQALSYLLPCARAGNPAAQYIMGVVYDVGEGVPQNHSEAARWYRLAADQGVALAQANLGAMYFFGLGVVQDDAEAARWLRSAAEQGIPKAQLHLGAMYADGRGVPQDDVQAYYVA